MAKSNPQWLERFSGLPLHDIAEGMRGRFIHSDHMTLAFWEIDEGFVLPKHKHPHEQITHMIEGAFELCVDERTEQLKPGAVVVIPGGSLHSGKAHTACRILDIFYPKREDYQFG